ncbi:VWA-like domain-containing protein [Mastigocoleus sp. MO_188.B34]|uniref:vWA domain-containing protein n=1 Tax=Mastigocoleus sp. MO_188.B34 TaxID=3036635 RepID=UPI00260DAEF6|nr:VWA-like domain-containing protein [Mastigocoleus sp. MO_188.B34]MDJ0693918.1 VWA-like domain-containing protein [Mastigocoleus sp. MO_188.B34]
MKQSIDKIISASLLRLRMREPFFATLALFASFIQTNEHSTAGTDGKNIFVNYEFLLSLTRNQQDGLLLHEVLHAALLHVVRRGTRDPIMWNIAADIVVNGIIAEDKNFELPPGAIRDLELEKFTVEEVYELLQKDVDKYKTFCLADPDLLESGLGDSSNDNANSSADSLSISQKQVLKTYWRNALARSETIALSKSGGNIPGGIARELGAIKDAQLDWRSYLWRYLVKTPTDFSGFDRRFISRGLYLENLEGESVKVYVAVDTSGSIDNKELSLFLGEIDGIINSYPHLDCELYYADSDIYGPYSLDNKSSLPTPEGGGGALRCA